MERNFETSNYLENRGRVMKSKKTSLLALFLAMAMFLSAVPVAAFVDKNVEANGSYVEGEAIVCVDPSQAPLLRGRSANTILSSYETEELMRLPVEAVTSDENGQSEFQPFFGPVDTSQRLMLVKSETETTEEMIQNLEQDPTVVYAEPNRYLELYSNDPMAAGQWQIENNSDSTGSQTKAEINTKTAWNESYTGGEPVVAVVDTGVDYLHEDIKDRMWTDENENSSLRALGGGKYGFSPADNDTTNPLDTVIGHGTHCAGIIAGEMDNNLGGVGIAGNLNAKIMAVKILAGDGPGKVDTALKAFAYILTAKTEEKVNVVAINNSWGPAEYDGERERSLGLAADALGEAGIISCYAAGNENTNADLNTGGLVVSDYAINVGSIDSAGKRSPFSNYGEKSVDVMAPGSQILSAVPRLELNLDAKEGMLGQYLPRYSSDNYFYRDYNTDISSDTITYQLVDNVGNPVPMTATTGNGYQSNGALSIPLNDVQVDQAFSVEVIIPADLLPDAKDKEAYVNMMVGTDGFKTGDLAVVSYKKPDGEWQRLGYASTYDSRWINLQGRWDKYPYDDTTALVLRLQFCNIVEGHLQAVGFETTSSNPTVLIDDFGIGKTRSDYAYANGTSMASPVVAGIAALVATKYPNETEKNIARIKGGVNREAPQNNTIVNSSVSMGYVDATKSVGQETGLVPVLNEMTVDGGEATIKGYFFGASGKVEITGSTASVLSWSDEEIVFALPENAEGSEAVTVTNASNEYGRNFFTVTPDTKGYETLSAPNIAYETKTDWGTIHSAQFATINLVGAGNYLLRAGYAQEFSLAAFELYDRTTDTWRTISPPKIVAGDGIAITGGATKFYVAYDSAENGRRLAVYDPAADKWLSDEPLAASGVCGLVAYGDRLLAVGGLAEGAEEFSSEIIVIDPNTGKKMGDFLDLPFGMILPKGEVAGGRLVIHGGYFLDDQDNLKKNHSVFLGDGSSWSDITPDFEPLTRSVGIDPQQVMDTAYGAGTDQLLATGPVSGLDTENMEDTWQSAYTKEGWQARQDVLFSQQKTFADAGQAYGQNFYVLASTSRAEEPLIFRSMPLATTDPTVDPVGVTPPDPSPVDPQPTAQVSGYRTSTGDETPLGLWLALAAAAAVGLGLVVYYRRKVK